MTILLAGFFGGCSSVAADIAVKEAAAKIWTEPHNIEGLIAVDIQLMKMH